VSVCARQYVLSVGATQLSAGASSRALCSRVYANSPMCSSFSSRSVESVCAADTGGEITTGGGFSNIWPAPPFQRPHVHAYLHHHRHLLPTQADFFNHGTKTDCTCECMRARRSETKLIVSLSGWLTGCPHALRWSRLSRREWLRHSLRHNQRRRNRSRSWNKRIGPTRCSNHRHASEETATNSRNWSTTLPRAHR